jgi:nitroreductase
MIPGPAADSVLEDLLGSRHSCRAFLDRQVPDQVLDRIFELGQFTASWCNVQPWAVHLVGGESVRDFARALSEHALSGDPESDFAYPQRYDGHYRDRRRDTAARLYDALGIAREDTASRSRQTAENFRFFGAPHVAIISTPRSMGIYGAIDCGAYISTLLLAAESMGIAAIAQAAPAVFSKFIRDYLSIGDDRLVVGTVSFGYEDAGHPANAFRTDRAALNAVISRT